MRPGLFGLVLSFALVTLAAGCDALTGPDERRMVGILSVEEHEAPAIKLPAVVKAGEEFVVTVTTMWSSGCARKGNTAVSMDGPTAVITPYDIITEARNQVCTGALQSFHHTVTLRFDEPGNGRVLVRVRKTYDTEIHTMEFDVTVQ